MAPRRALSESSQVLGVLTHDRSHLDEALWSVQAGPAEYLLEWGTDGGSLDMNKHDPSERIKGRSDTEAVDPDGTEVCDLPIRFDVDRCTAMEPSFFG